MKTIHSSLQLKIPEDITATVNNRVVSIKGKRGMLRKSFKHTQLDVKMIGKKRYKRAFYLFSHHHFFITRGLKGGGVEFL